MAAQRNSTHRLTPGLISAFVEYLREEEREENTIQKYVRYVREFACYLDGRDASKSTAVEWKESLQDGRFAPATVNAKIASLNAFFGFAGWGECRVKSLRLQKRVFRDPGRELSREDYERLIRTAHQKGDERLTLVMETICATGIRVSEVKYITVNAVNEGRAVISLKGKIRTIILPGKLCKQLLKYIRKNKIVSGEVFLTRNGTGMSRRQIWAEMKKLCDEAGVEPAKVFPHNLRHLFARTYYRVYRDIVKLADVLGHSCVETTRVYLISTGREHARQMDRLGLVV